MFSLLEFITEAKAALEPAKKLRNDPDHLRYFDERSSKEINGPGIDNPEVGRGKSLPGSEKVTAKHPGFQSTVFRHGPTGSRLIPTSQAANPKPDADGNINKEFFVLSPEGKVSKTKIPLNQVHLTETKDTGKHNDEHGLRRVWNYFSQIDKNSGVDHRENIMSIINDHAKRKKDPHDAIVQYMHDEIGRSLTDKKHNLHYHQAENGEFIHGKSLISIKSASPSVKARAQSSHTENMRNAALSVARLLQDKKHKNLFQNDFEMDGTGQKIAKLNDNARKFGMREGSTSGTYKSDLVVFNPRTREEAEGIKLVSDEGISVKKGGGSQIESPDAKGFNVLYAHSINKHCDEAIKANPKKAKQIEQLREQAHNIRRQLGGYEGSDSTELAATNKALGIAPNETGIGEGQPFHKMVSNLSATNAAMKKAGIVKKKVVKKVAAEGIMHRKAKTASLENPKENNVQVAQRKLNDLHSIMSQVPHEGNNDFESKLWTAGTNGEHKIEGHEGTASLILKQGVAKKNKRAEAMGVPQFVESLRNPVTGKLPMPEVSTAKHGGLVGLRMRTS